MKDASKFSRPLLFVDVDGVISTYGFAANREVPSGTRPIGGAAIDGGGTFHNVEGVIHHIGHGMSARMLSVLPHFEAVWATGWGSRANDHLVHLLSLPEQLEVVEFAVAPSSDGSGHWKLDALTARAAGRAAAWIDDGFNDACFEWAAERVDPTLLIGTDPAVGWTDSHVDELIAWADALAR
ncbi:MAG: HAD domain-containing protein [Solirubrobacterales bacterium]